MTDPTHLETWGIVDAVLDDRTNLSGRWIAEGIARYTRPAAPQTVIPEVLAPTVGEVVNPVDSMLEWLSTQADKPPVNPDTAPPVTSRAKRLSRLRKAAPDTSADGKGEGGVKWADGELDFIRKLSPERQKVWRWCKGLTVTNDEPSCRDASAETGISQETSNKALKQYRAYHGIGQG